MWDSRVVIGLLAATCAVACASKPQQQAVMMNSFVADDKIASVRICQTTGQELVKSFGAPSGQGRDGDMGVLNWSSVAMITSPGQATMGSQMIMAWIDGDGLVAGFIVNTVGMPQKPAPCREQSGEPADEKPAAPEPARVKPSEA